MTKGSGVNYTKNGLRISSGEKKELVRSISSDKPKEVYENRVGTGSGDVDDKERQTYENGNL